MFPASGSRMPRSLMTIRRRLHYLYPTHPTMAPTMLRPSSYLARASAAMHEEVAMLLLFFVCLVMFLLVIMADRISAARLAEEKDWESLERGDNGDGDRSAVERTSERADIKPSETTPLLSPNPTLVGSDSETECPSRKGSESSAEWPTAAKDILALPRVRNPISLALD